jgi:hypothetical protein
MQWYWLQKFDWANPGFPIYIPSHLRYQGFFDLVSGCAFWLTEPLRKDYEFLNKKANFVRVS